MTSDPQWWEKAFRGTEPGPEELEQIAEAKRRRERVRAQLVIEGRVSA